MTRCPSCNTEFMITAVTNNGRKVTVDAPLYQRSYKGEPEYISPRCYRCYDKMERRLLRKLVRDAHTQSAIETGVS